MNERRLHLEYASRGMLPDFPTKLYDEDAGRAGLGSNPGASARGR
jgi:hypothetical protein